MERLLAAVGRSPQRLGEAIKPTQAAQLLSQEHRAGGCHHAKQTEGPAGLFRYKATILERLGLGVEGWDEGKQKAGRRSALSLLCHTLGAIFPRCFLSHSRSLMVQSSKVATGSQEGSRWKPGRD